MFDSRNYDPPVPSDTTFVPTGDLDRVCNDACGIGSESGGAADCVNVGMKAKAECNAACTSDCVAACPSGCTQRCQSTAEYGACQSSCEAPCQAGCAPQAEQHCRAAAEPGSDIDKQCNGQCKATCSWYCDARIVCTDNGSLFFGGSCLGGNCGKAPVGAGVFTWSTDVCSNLEGCEYKKAVNGVKPDGNIDTPFALCTSVASVGWCCNTACFDCCAQGDCPSDLNTCTGHRHSCHDDCIDIFLHGINPSQPTCDVGRKGGCIDQHTQDCERGCTPACSSACSSDCISSCNSTCEDTCRNGDLCLPLCDHDFTADCKQGCVATCKTKLANKSGVAYGNPAAAGHNLTRITNGDGVLYVQNTYEKSIASPDFDRVIQQVFGDDVITYHHHDLSTPGAPAVPAEDGPFVKDAAARVEICPRTCVDNAGPEGSDHLVAVGDGSYLAFREPTPPGIGLTSWPVDVPEAFNVFRWFEIQAVGEVFELVPYAPIPPTGFTIETPLGLLVGHSLDGASGAISLEGLSPDALRTLMVPEEGVVLTLVRTTRGWRGYRGRAAGAVAITPGDACGDEFVASRVGAGELEFGAGQGCSGAFTAREIGRRPGEIAASTWRSPIASPWGALFWSGSHLVGYAGGGDPWRPSPVPAGTCPGLPPIDRPCIDAMLAFSAGPPGIDGPPNCNAPWWGRGAGAAFLNDGPMDRRDVVAACGPGVIGPGGPMPAPPLPPVCHEQGYAAAQPSPVTELQPITDVAVVRDGAGTVWSYYADRAGVVYRVVNNSSGARTERNYTPHGLLLGELRPFGDRSCMLYDEADNPVEEALLPSTSPAVVSTVPPNSGGVSTGGALSDHAIRSRASYGAFGLIETQYDPNQPGLVPLVNTHHDGRGNLVSVEYPSIGYSLTATVDARGRVTRYTYPDGAQVGTDYDPASGQWWHTTLDLGGPAQRTRTAVRDPFGRMLSMTEPGRPSYAWTWRPDNQPASETVQLDPTLAAVTTIFGFNGAGQLHVVAGPEVTRSIFRNKRGLLEHFTDTPTANTGDAPRTSCFGYDGRGLATETVDPEGRRVRFTRDANGLVTQVLRGIWASSAASWDDACAQNVSDGAAVGQETFETITRDDVHGGVIISKLEGSARDSSPWLESYGLDGFGRSVEAKLADGSLYRAGFDARGDIVWRAAYRPGAPPYSAALGSDGYPDPAQAKLATLRTSTFDPLNRITDDGVLWFADDIVTGRQMLGPDHGWLHTTTHYIDAKHAVDVTDAEGRVTHTEFDFFGRPAFERLRDGQTTVHWERTNDGRQVTKTTAPAATASGQLIEHLDIANFGEVAGVHDASQALIWQKAFDAHGRVTTFAEPSRTTVTTYTAYGEVKAISRMRTGGVLEPFIAYGYRRDGQLGLVRDGLRHETTTAFDFAGRPVKETFPDGTTASETYRPGTRAVASRIDRNGDASTIEYDVFHAPSRIAGARATAAPGWEGTTSITFERDVLGIESALSTNRPSDPTDDVTLVLEHDSTGAVVMDVEGAQAGFSWGAGFRQDAFGRITIISTANQNLSLGYEPLGQLHTLALNDQNLVQYVHQGAGLPTTVVFGNGITERRTFDERGRVIVAQGAAGGAPVYEHDLHYLGDALVRVDQKLGPSGAPVSDVFEPDDVGRVMAAGHGGTNLAPASPASMALLGSEVAASPHVERFAFDAADDWTGVNVDAISTSPVVGPDLRYTSFGSGVSSDAEGNTTQLPDGTSLGFDGLGRLVRAVDAAGHVYTFSWDPLGRLATASDPEGQSSFAHLGEQILAESKAGSPDTALYVPGPGLAPAALVSLHPFNPPPPPRPPPPCRTSPSDGPSGLPICMIVRLEAAHPTSVSYRSGVSYAHSAHGERIAFMTDSSGALIERYAYSAYGAPTIFGVRPGAADQEIATSAIGNRALLAGAPYFAGLGLYQMGARWYRPSWGRFITPDPLGFAAGPNRFAYAGNSPTMYVDPSGLWQQRALDGVADVWFTASDAVNGFHDGAFIGGELGERNGHPGAYAIGKIGGALSGFVADAGGIAGGYGLATGSLVLCSSGGGCLAGAPALTVGTAIAGASVAGIGLHNGRLSEGLQDLGGVREDVEPSGSSEGQVIAQPEEAEWKVAPHGEMPDPRPDGYQSHHGVNSIWAEVNISGYRALDAPAVLMKNNPFHNATRGVFNRIRAEIAAQQCISPRVVDWSKVSPGTAWRIAEEQFEAAQVPEQVRVDYFNAFNDYLERLLSGEP